MVFWWEPHSLHPTPFPVVPVSVLVHEQPLLTYTFECGGRVPAYTQRVFRLPRIPRGSPCHHLHTSLHGAQREVVTCVLPATAVSLPTSEPTTRCCGHLIKRLGLNKTAGVLLRNLTMPKMGLSLRSLRKAGPSCLHLPLPW